MAYDWKVHFFRCFRILWQPACAVSRESCRSQASKSIVLAAWLTSCASHKNWIITKNPLLASSYPIFGAVFLLFLFHPAKHSEFHKRSRLLSRRADSVVILMRNLLEIHFEQIGFSVYPTCSFLRWFRFASRWVGSIYGEAGALVYIAARDVVESLCRDLEFYAFKSGEVIVRQGEEGDHLFIVEA